MSERIKVGLSLVEFWGIYGTKRVEFEIKRRRMANLSSSNLEKIQQLGGSLHDRQAPLIDATDAVSKSLSQADFRSTSSMEEFVENFPDDIPETKSLSVLQRREELTLERMAEAGELIDDYGKKLLEITREYLKSLF